MKKFSIERLNIFTKITEVWAGIQTQFYLIPSVCVSAGVEKAKIETDKFKTH